jgi:hypothetical protein
VGREGGDGKEMIEATRRGFLVGLSTGIALLAAPAIVRASSIMPVSKVPPAPWRYYYSYVPVSVLRSELVLEVKVNGSVVDYELLDYNRMLLASLPDGGALRIPVPPIGSFNTDIMKLRKRVE